MKNPADDDNQKVTALIRNQIDLRWGFSALELALSFRVCQMCSGSDVKAYLEVSDLIEYIESNGKQYINTNYIPNENKFKDDKKMRKKFI